MRKVLLFLVVLPSACGGEATPPSGARDNWNDGGTEVLFLPASSPTGVTTSPLRAGATYNVVVEGSFSVWPPSDWSNLCAGTPSPAPEFPSPGATGPAGVDPEWVWAWPKASPSLCPNGLPSGAPPAAERNVVFQATNGAGLTNLPPPKESTMTSNHAYTYAITGMGEAAVFIVSDAHPGDRVDNYGELRVQITPE